MQRNQRQADIVPPASKMSVDPEILTRIQSYIQIQPDLGRLLVLMFDDLEKKIAHDLPSHYGEELDRQIGAMKANSDHKQYFTQLIGDSSNDR